MLSKQIKKFKDYFKNDDGNNKKKIENLVVFVIILIITIVIINMVLKEDKKSGELDKTNTTKTLAKSESSSSKFLVDEDNNKTYEDDLEENLENILSKIEGVGRVNVLVTYSQTSQIVALYNEDNVSNNTEENDSRRWQ